VAGEHEANGGITDDEVTRLLPALAEAERATEETAARFVPPRPGILEEVSARRHQFVYGRRGVGKSTLLRRVEADGAETERAVIFVDIETLRGRPYPDVLIELLKELLDDLERRLRADGFVASWKRRKLRRRVRALSAAMSSLLQAPQMAEHTVSTLRSQATKSGSGWSAGAKLKAAARKGPAGASAEAGAHLGRGHEQEDSSQSKVEARFERTKMDGLVEAALLIRNVSNATERESHQFRPKNRITAEDVAQAATALYEQKQDELKRDAEDEADRLRSRLSELVRFCVETHRTNVFLIETTKLQEEEWGKEVQALADLRFVHRVATLSTKRAAYAGRKFAAFTIDLSTWTSTRSEQIKPISFWEREGRQKIRDPNLIYTPAGVPVAAGEEALEAEQLEFEFEEAPDTSGT
jgi:hypothetical protein